MFFLLVNNVNKELLALALISATILAYVLSDSMTMLNLLSVPAFSTLSSRIRG